MSLFATPQLAKKKMTDITVLLDASGSMHSCLDDTIGGFNAFIQKQKLTDTPCRVTLIQFDQRCNVVYDSKPLKDVDNLTYNSYVPSGGTALLDSLAHGIALAKAREDSDTNIFVVITDGYDNASEEFKGEEGAALVKSLVDECEEKLEWNFIYMGADQNAFSTASSMGFKAGKVMTYSKGKGTKVAFDSVSSVVESTRSLEGFGGMMARQEVAAFTEKDLKEQEAHGIVNPELAAVIASQ